MKRAKWSVLLASAMLASAAYAQPSLQTLVTNGLAEPYGVAVDSDNNYYVADSANNRIAKYNPNSGSLTNLAGAPGEIGNSDGPGVFARFFNPEGIIVARGGLVIADSGNHRIRRVGLDGTATTLAGSVQGFNDGAGAAAQFNSPAGLAVDLSGNIYVADTLNNRIRKIDPANVVTTVASGFSRPTALAFNKTTGELYVADTDTHSIRVINSDGSVGLIAGSGLATTSGLRNSLIGTNALFDRPRGLLWVEGKTGLVVSDTGNKVLRRAYFNTNNNLNAYSVETFAGPSALLASPVGLALDKDGNFPVAELRNNSLLLVQVTTPQPPVSDPRIGFVILSTNNFGQLRTELVPVTTGTFNNDVTVAILAERGTDTFFTLDSNANFPEDAGSRFTPPAYANGLVEWSTNLSLIKPLQDGSNVTIRAVSTQQGRRPSQIVTARFQFNVAGPIINGKDPGDFTLDDTTLGAQLWYTTDDTSPSPANPSARKYLGVPLDIVNGTNNVTFKVRGFKDGYNASPEISRLFFFSDLQTTRIGIARDFNAGIGSTIVVPVEALLVAGKTLRSLQFRVEVTPVAPNTNALISTQFRTLPITTNDFIRIPVPATNAPLTTVYTTNRITTGLTASFIGTSSGLDFKNSGIIALLAVPIPPTATNVGQKYEIQVLQASATSDGLQTPVRMSTMDKRTITITNLSYMVGDSAIATWYNAGGDFGDTNLNNNDVNNAFHASLGLGVPYSFSDVFDAMDAFPEDSANAVGGDGQIRFLDWQIILQRSLRPTSAVWRRSWSGGGSRVPSLTTLSTATGPLWRRQAALRAEAVDHAAPGKLVEVPVRVRVAPGNRLKGLQFRAKVIADNSAPVLNAPADFNPMSSLPRPILLQGSQDGLPLNEAACAWSLVQNSFPTALENDQLLGFVRFVVPGNAQAGQTYTIRFANVDGAPDLQTQYDFESLPASVWVGTPAQRKAEVISDEWKLVFFGSLTDSWAQADADADGDGVSNALEFVAGSNPVKLRFHNLGDEWRRSVLEGGFKLRWFAEPGRTYRIEGSGDLLKWSSIAERTGRGGVEEVTDPNVGRGNQYYRLGIKASQSTDRQ